MDCDDVSLPDSETQEATWQESRSRRRLATLAVVLDDGEEGPPVFAQIEAKLLAQTQPLASLACEHLDLGDRNLQRLLELLQPSLTTQADDELVVQTRVATQWSRIDAYAQLAKCSLSQPAFGQLRILHLDDNGITDAGLCSLSRYVARSHSLRALSLAANLFGSDPDVLHQFGRCIGSSTVQCLRLNSNPIGPRSFESFSLGLQQDGCPLTVLNMACTLDMYLVEPSPTDDERVSAARAVARLISSDTKCQRLRKLDLAANGYTASGLRAIYAAFIGSAREPCGQTTRQDWNMLFAEWEFKYGMRLSRNMTETSWVRSAAVEVAQAARILGCCARRGKNCDITQAGSPQFWDLPAELRLLVVRHLDARRSLTERQFHEVVSWSQERSTIGYGTPTFDWDMLLQHAPQAATRPEATSALSSETRSTAQAQQPVLPCHPWSWHDCFAYRAPPRDWAATFDGQISPHDDGMDAFLACTGTDVPDPSAPLTDEPTEGRWASRLCLVLAR